jgi:hypothetical protein
MTTHAHEIVTAFWSPSCGGPVQMFRMHEMDFLSAKKRFPKQWSLEPPPKDAEVTDRTDTRQVFEGLGRN